MSIKKIDEPVLKAISDILGDTHRGFTGWQIAEMLEECGIEDPGEMTKRVRLFEALRQQQSLDQHANVVCAFIEHAMYPAKYVQQQEWFSATRDLLNKGLAFEGLTLGEDGKLKEIQATTTLPSTHSQTCNLMAVLHERNIHPDVVRFCEKELLDENYFHAVLEATKSVSEKIRTKSGLTGDGTKLAQQAFRSEKPILSINAMNTQSRRDEQNGFANLLTGLFMMYRNPLSHEPKITWPIEKDDAIDVLSFISLIHRRIDGCEERLE